MEKKYWVAIKGGKWRLIDSAPQPKEGEIYTEGPPSVDGIEWIRLIELGIRYCYRRNNFRPVDMSFGKEKCESIERQPVKQLA